MTPSHYDKPMVVPAESAPDRTKRLAPAEAVKARRPQRETSIESNRKSRRTHVPWLDDEVSSILAWICKHKDEWADNKRECVDTFYKTLIKGRHTHDAIYIKVHNLELKFAKCFEFVRYKGQDKPVRKAIPENIQKIKFFKECRAAFGLPQLDKCTVRNVDAYPPPPKTKEKTPPVITPTQEQSSRETQRPSDSPKQIKRAHSESMTDTPSPPPLAKKARRSGVVADDSERPSFPQLEELTQKQDPVDSKDRAVFDSPLPAQFPIADEIQAPNEDQTHEVKLKRQELMLLIQGTRVKIERSEVRFERLREKHEYHQERRRMRLSKYKEELNRLMMVE